MFNFRSKLCRCDAKNPETRAPSPGEDLNFRNKCKVGKRKISFISLGGGLLARRSVHKGDEHARFRALRSHLRKPVHVSKTRGLRRAKVHVDFDRQTPGRVPRRSDGEGCRSQLPIHHLEKAGWGARDGKVNWFGR